MERDETFDTPDDLTGGDQAAWKRKTRQAVDSTKHAVEDAYRATADRVGAGYERTLDYGRDNPERFGLIAFAAGVGTGLLLAALLAPRR